jgi:signal transduction histidine kinase
MAVTHHSIRFRIFILILIPLLSLTGLYVFATVLTANDAIQLARSPAVWRSLAGPTASVEVQVDSERMLAVIYLAQPAAQNKAAFIAQQAQTDRAWQQLHGSIASNGLEDGGSQAERSAAATLSDSAGALSAMRHEITLRSWGRGQAEKDYDAIIQAANNFLAQVIMADATETSVPLVTQGLAAIRMSESADLLQRETAMLIADMTAGSFPAADQQQFTELAGARREIFADSLAELQPPYRTYYLQDVSPRALAALTSLENTVIATPRLSPPPVPAEKDQGAVPGQGTSAPVGAPGTRGAQGLKELSPAAAARLAGLPAIQPRAFEQAATTVSQGLSAAGYRAGDALVSQATGAADGARLRLILAGGLGLLAVIASVFVSLRIGRDLVRQLAELRRSALELANERLPRLMARLNEGEAVDVAAEALPLQPGTDEIGQLREAFNSVQRTAIEAAVSQARLRAGISSVFRNLARRSQSLLHRQLHLLDEMEGQAAGPEELESLFRIDHLTTRMRRHAEGLIVLAGERPARGWRYPVPMMDVLRAAVAEVEDYTRIRVVITSDADLTGPAVADVIHMVAELAENATIFSPPHTPVQITGGTVANGFVVEVEDRGLGITDEEMTDLNAKLARPPEFDLMDSEELGLYVAARLAKRHRIRITLRPSPYGGTTAIVFIPKDLIVIAGRPQTRTEDDQQAVRATGRHAARMTSATTVPLELTAIPGGPAASTSTSTSNGTSNGHGTDTQKLPRRAPQSGRPAELPQDLPGTADALDIDRDDVRSPHQVRDTFTALQRGWQRGRAEPVPGTRGASPAVPEVRRVPPPANTSVNRPTG